MKHPVLFARFRRLLPNLGDATVSGNRFPIVSRMFHRLLHLKVNETQVLLVSGLVVGIGAGLGAVIFRELISGCTFLFFNLLRPQLSRLLGSSAVIVLPAIGGLIFGPLIYLFAREAKGHGVPEVMLAVAQKGGRIRRIVAAISLFQVGCCLARLGSSCHKSSVWAIQR